MNLCLMEEKKIFHGGSHVSDFLFALPSFEILILTREVFFPSSGRPAAPMKESNPANIAFN